MSGLPVEGKSPRQRHISSFKEQNRKRSVRECADLIDQLYSCSDWPKVRARPTLGWLVTGDLCEGILELKPETEAGEK